MNIDFDIEDKIAFLKNIGYKVEKTHIMYTINNDRHYNDETETKVMHIAYKGKIPNTDIGYKSLYDFENKYSLQILFEKHFPKHLINLILK